MCQGTERISVQRCILPRHGNKVQIFPVSSYSFPFVVPTKEAALSKAPFINLEMNEMGIGCWGGQFQI